MLESHLVPAVKISCVFYFKSVFYEIDGNNLILNYGTLAMLSS